jgi:FtsH-binding integral membrane protein
MTDGQEEVEMADNNINPQTTGAATAAAVAADRADRQMDNQIHANDGDYEGLVKKKKRRIVDKDGNDVLKDFMCCGVWKTARQAFIIKTYAITAVMLAITAACVCIVTLVPAAKSAMKKYSWVCYIFVGFGLVLMVTIIVGKKLARSNPWNYILLVLFTLCWSGMVSFLTTFYKPETVMIAAVTTAFMTVGLTVIALSISSEINWCWGVSGALAFALIPFIYFAFA